MATPKKIPEPVEPADVARTAPVLLHHGYWMDGVKHARGTTIMLTPEDARRILAEGKADRADPLPGE